jgi:hypothetical protein
MQNYKLEEEFKISPLMRRTSALDCSTIEEEEEEEEEEERIIRR